MKTNYDRHYPDSYHKSDQLEKYVDERINMIAEIITVVGIELTEKDFGYFKSELGDYFNEI